MSLDSKLFWKAFKQANECDLVDCLTPAKAAPYLKWLEARIRNPALLELVREFPLAEDEQLCAHYFYGPRMMKQVTKSSRLLEKEYLVIGSTANGDYIVIPLARPAEVGFVNHETLDDQRGVCEYISICNSVGGLYYNSWNKQEFPADYYDAVRNPKRPRVKHRSSRRKEAPSKRNPK